MNSRVPATQLFILPVELDLVLSVLSYTGLENTEVLWTLVFLSALKEVKSSPLISSFFVAIQLLVHVIFYPNAVISRCFIFQSTFFFFSFLFGTTVFLSHDYLEFICAKGAVMRSGVSLGTENQGTIHVHKLLSREVCDMEWGRGRVGRWKLPGLVSGEYFNKLLMYVKLDSCLSGWGFKKSK